jgi:hypothetical protein
VKPLYKTAAVIWTESDPSKGEFILMDLPILAEYKYGWCSSMKTVRVADPEKDREWNDTDFLRRVRQRRRVRVPITLSLAYPTSSKRYRDFASVCHFPKVYYGAGFRVRWGIPS